MPMSRHERDARLRGAQMIALLYSVIFIALIFVGYYLLFQENILVAVLAGTILAMLAWGIARFIGMSEGGIREHIPEFILLLIISAFGVFNSLMLNLEGRPIFLEAIDNARDQFDAVGTRARTELGRGGTDSPLAHMRRVENLKAALFSEIRNPLNCGQGPEARKILASLREELPDFRELSNPRVDCAQNAKVIEDYDARISQLVERAPWGNQVLMGVVEDTEASKKKMDKLAGLTGESFAAGLLTEVKPQLELEAARYRELYDRLPPDSEAGLSSRLDLRSVESLGEWSQAINLLFDRWNKLTTWFYIALAVFADWMMIRLFARVRANRGRRSEAKGLGAPVGRGWN